MTLFVLSVHISCMTVLYIRSYIVQISRSHLSEYIETGECSNVHISETPVLNAKKSSSHFPDVIQNKACMNIIIWGVQIVGEDSDN